MTKLNLFSKEDVTSFLLKNSTRSAAYLVYSNSNLSIMKI